MSKSTESRPVGSHVTGGHSASAASSSDPPARPSRTLSQQQVQQTPIQAPPIRPPPLYSIIAPGLHRCSAIGLEEALIEAWTSLEASKPKKMGGSNGQTGTRGGSGNPGAVTPSLSRPGYSRSSTSYMGILSMSSQDPGVVPDRAPSSTSRPNHDGGPSTESSTRVSSPLNISNPSSLSQTDIESSQVLSFLSTLRLKTLIYLSPSLLPTALLKLANDFDLNLVQWDLSRGRIWRRRQNKDVLEAERIALNSFVGMTTGGKDSHSASTQHHQPHEAADQLYDETDLSGLDLRGMCKATVELMLNRHCGGVMICDPSGLSETSLVVGCLRRMMRWNFASVCLEVSQSSESIKFAVVHELI